MHFKDDELHGLSITWWDSGHIYVYLYKNGSCLGCIEWKTSNWTEAYSYNPSLFDGVVSINDFRP